MNRRLERKKYWKIGLLLLIKVVRESAEEEGKGRVRKRGEGGKRWREGREGMGRWKRGNGGNEERGWEREWREVRGDITPR